MVQPGPCSPGNANAPEKENGVSLAAIPPPPPRATRPSSSRVFPVSGVGPQGELRALLHLALQTLLAVRHVEAGLAERVRQRAERVPVERLRRHRALARVDVLRRRRPAELLAQLAQEPEQLGAGREAARD